MEALPFVSKKILEALPHIKIQRVFLFVKKYFDFEPDPVWQKGESSQPSNRLENKISWSSNILYRLLAILHFQLFSWDAGAS